VAPLLVLLSLETFIKWESWEVLEPRNEPFKFPSDGIFLSLADSETASDLSRPAGIPQSPCPPQTRCCAVISAGEPGNADQNDL
jgi:hypothetical protein